VKIRIRVAVVIKDDFVKNFMDSWIFWVEWIVALEITGAINIHFHVLVLLISFATSDAVYRNSVIIPEENVRISKYAIHLLLIVFQIFTVAIIEMIRMHTEREIGLVFVIMRHVATRIAVEISLGFLIYKINVFYKLLRILMYV